MKNKYPYYFLTSRIARRLFRKGQRQAEGETALWNNPYAHERKMPTLSQIIQKYVDCKNQHERAYHEKNFFLIGYYQWWIRTLNFDIAGRARIFNLIDQIMQTVAQKKIDVPTMRKIAKGVENFYMVRPHTFVKWIIDKRSEKLHERDLEDFLALLKQYQQS